MKRWILCGLAGALGGGVAAAAFLVLHAVVIIPLWRGVVTGVLAASIAGAIISCAFEVIRARAPRPEEGLLFGLLLWSALLPATFVTAVLHDHVSEPAEVTTAITMTALYGGLIGSLFGNRHLSATIAGALVGLAVLIRAGGPLTHFQSQRAILMFAGLLPVTITYAMAVVLAMRFTQRAA